MAEGTITLRDIIEEDALVWGDKYAVTVQKAIDKNDELVRSAQQLFEIYQKIQGVKNKTSFVDAQTKGVEASTKAMKSYEERAKALGQVDLERQRALRNLLAVENSLQNVQSTTNKQLVERRERLRQDTAEIKSNLTAMGRLVFAREAARKSIQEYQARLALGQKLSDKEQSELAQSTAAFNKYDKAVRTIKESTNQFQENVGNYPKQFQAITSGIKQLIPVLGVVAGIRVTFGVIRDAFNDIVEFDRQLIAVGKTTNITGEALKDFGRTVVNVGRDLDGISVIGLLRTAEIAGTLGVKGTDNLLKFSEAIERLKLTSDIISDEQVQNFAQFIEVSKDSFKNADRLGSVLTQLGNNFATTEAKVLGNATEIQKSLAIYNASAQGILGLGAATSALGSEAETSRTAIQKTFAIIDKAIFSGENLEKILKLTGLTQKELSKQFSQDATGVFVKFIGGISKATEEGENFNQILGDLGISEIRATTVIGALSSNFDILTSAVNTANIEYEENQALLQESEAAAESVASIIGDLKDRWSAYSISTSDANGFTEKAAELLKFLRDNLEGIITGFIKYGSVLLAYGATLKLVSLTTATYTALKTAAAAAELNFAVKTGIGRTAVLAKAQALKAATLAQTGMNIAMVATPWGVVLAALAAVVVAYTVFNNSLSENEKLQKNINDNIERRKKLLEESAEFNREIDDKQMKRIEEEFALKRATQGASIELTNQEIEAKRKYLNNSRDFNAMQIKANRDLLNNTKETSSETIKILEEEAKKAREIANNRSSGALNGALNFAASEAERRLKDARLASKNQINNLSITNEALLEENRQYNDKILELDKAQRLREAEARKEANEESKKAREKRLKEQEELKKLLESDKYNLEKTILRQAIEAEKEMLNNTKLTTGERLSANLDYYTKSVALLDFEKLRAITNAKGRKDEITRIQLEYNADMAKLEKERSKNSEGILEDAFDKTLNKLEAQKKLEEDFFNDDVTRLQEVLNQELSIEGISNKQKLTLIKKYEDDLLKLKQEGAKNRLELQIKAIEQELAINQNLDPEQRIALEELLAQAKIALSDQVTDNAISNARKQEEAELRILELKKKILSDASQSLADSLNLDAQNIENLFSSFLLKAETTGDAVIDKFNEVSRTISQIGAVTQVTGDIFQSIFDANISRIDDQISQNEEFYNRQFELAEGDQAQQDLIREEQELKRQQLEEKKRLEQIKAAKFAKAFSVFSIGITTAQAIIAALAPPPIGLGPLLGQPLAITAGALGALQIAAVLAKPIPKYELGTDYHMGGYAQVAEKRPEVIHEPGKRPYVVSSPSVLDLKKGSKVYKSLDHFRKIGNGSMKKDLKNQSKRLSQFDGSFVVDNDYSEVTKELRELKNETKKNRPPRNSKPTDFNHEYFRFKNTRWNG